MTLQLGLEKMTTNFSPRGVLNFHFGTEYVSRRAENMGLEAAADFFKQLI